MPSPGGTNRRWRAVGVATLLALPVAAAGCGGPSGGTVSSRSTGAAGSDAAHAPRDEPDAAPDPTADEALAAVDATTTVPPDVTGSLTYEGSVDGGAADATTSIPAPTVVSPSAPTGADPTPDGDATSSLAGFSDGTRSGPAQGSGTALLRQVRVGVNDGFERIVFEFEGTARPAYRIRWSNAPVTADGSGEVVAVAGAGTLEIVMQPASGVDPDDGTLAYTGPDRITIPDSHRVLRDLVRTGDFEAVLTWVAGADRDRPFRVLTLASPTRLVVDVRT